MTVQLYDETATPDQADVSHELVDFIDDTFMYVQEIERHGDYVKYDILCDIVLDIRQKALDYVR